MDGGTSSARALPLGAFAATLGVVGPDPARLVRQASEALLAGAGRAGVIIGVDDAHLLDELSAVLVHQLVLRRAASVVLTLRTGESAPDAVTALWKDGHLPRLELHPLSETETAMLVEARLGGPVDSVAARRLWSITHGNALYLRQLVDGELESRRLHQVAGVWRWSGELALSPGLVELVSARIGRLPEAQREVVEVLAFGEPLGIPLLVGLTDALAVEQVEARGLIEVYPDGACEGARTPALAALTAPLPLTDRERESSPSPPAGCPTVRSPNGSSSRCAPWKTTSTAPAPNSHHRPRRTHRPTPPPLN